MKKKVAVVGATGIAGQQFVAALKNHPWFEITAMAGSSRSAGKNYEQALRDEKTGALGWFAGEIPPKNLLNLRVQNSENFHAESVDLVFSAIDTEPARELEPQWARTTPVVSAASAFRMEEDVPLLIPGINNDHIRLIDVQKRNRGWKGYIVPIPNCTTTGMAITLKPLHDAFGINTVLMTSMQAVSGAGRRGGVLALDALENVIPFISGEEEKVERETKKILGKFSTGKVNPDALKVSCTCTRVGVLDGHTETVFVSLKKKASLDQIKKHLEAWGARNIAGLPSAPPQMIVVFDDPFHPQPRVDRDLYDGMATMVGRLRQDSALSNGIKYVLLSHNTKMGAAKGAVLVAELLLKKRYL